MKSSIVKQMSAVRVETVERIQQTSNVIAEATSDISEVTVEAQVGFPTFYVRHINNLIGVGGVPSDINSTANEYVLLYCVTFLRRD